MGAEIGATTSIFCYDKKMCDYLKSTGRADLADWLIGLLNICVAIKKHMKSLKNILTRLLKLTFQNLSRT